MIFTKRESFLKKETCKNIQEISEKEECWTELSYTWYSNIKLHKWKQFGMGTYMDRWLAQNKKIKK